jgi:hypothetical protein
MSKIAKQYTIRVNDPRLNRAIREYADMRGKSINETVLDTLIKEINYKKTSKWAKYSAKIGSQPKVNKEFKTMRKVNKKDWQ